MLGVVGSFPGGKLVVSRGQSGAILQVLDAMSLHANNEKLLEVSEGDDLLIIDRSREN